MARAVELDLVEVAPNAKPPVCKIMDFGKFLYRQKKQDKKQKNAQKQKEIKGIRISMRIDTHDLQIKANRAIEFLKDRNSVKVQLIMRGRELSRIELAREKMQMFATMLGGAGALEDHPKRQGNSLIMMILPGSSGKRVASAGVRERGADDTFAQQAAPKPL